VTRGKTLTLPRLELPRRSFSIESTQSTSMSWTHILRFGLALLLTFVTFKLGSLRLALATVEKRKAASRRGAAVASALETQRLVHIFMQLRARFYTARRKCLFDSLTMCNFLARYGVFPVLVIGVSEMPFRAHSWLQQDDAVLNDDAEHVKEFKPLAVI
jgi:hypothetical protein